MLNIINGPFTVTGYKRKIVEAQCSYCGVLTGMVSETWANRHTSCGCRNRRAQKSPLPPKVRRAYQRLVKIHKNDIDPRWLDPQAFAEDMLPIPHEINTLSLRRIDRSLPFTKSNTHWAPPRRETPTFQPGQRRNYFTVIHQRPDHGDYLVQCQCGNRMYITPYALAHGKRLSCGCMK